MDAASEETRIAWQPLTPPGIAAFAHATTGRLLLVQLVFAMVAAFTVGWFVATGWFPVITGAIGELPAQGRIRSGKLEWFGSSPRLLAEDRFLSVAIDLEHKGEARSPAHVHVEFGQDDIKIFSILGYLATPYPPGLTIPFNRNELEPWWGAWEPPLLAILVGGVIGLLFCIWAVLAALYSVPVWVLGFFADRDLDLKRSWRVAGAALMPGALFISLCMVLYGLRLFDLPRLAMAFAVHLVIGWGFLLVSPFYVLRVGWAKPSLKQNPFSGAKQRSAQARGEQAGE